MAEKPDSGHAEAGVKQEMDQALPYDDSKSIENNETEKKLGIFDRVPSPPPSTSKHGNEIHVQQYRFFFFITNIYFFIKHRLLTCITM